MIKRIIALFLFVAFPSSVMAWTDSPVVPYGDTCRTIYIYYNGHPGIDDYTSTYTCDPSGGTPWPRSGGYPDNYTGHSSYVDIGIKEWNESTQSWDNVTSSYNVNMNNTYLHDASCLQPIMDFFGATLGVDYTDSNAVCDPVDPCQAQWDAGIAACNGVENLTVLDTEECTWRCSDCDDIYEDKLRECQLGLTTYSDITCEYDCNDCEDVYQENLLRCEDHGGLAHFDCAVRNGTENMDGTHEDDGFDIITALCSDEMPDTQDHTPDLPDGDDTPEPDPDPPDDAEEIAWLKKIKGNQDTQIGQGNKLLGDLSTVNENIKKVADNQGVINDSVNRVNKSLNEINQDISQFDQNQNTRFDNLADTIDSSIDQMRHDGPVPDTPEFNTDLPDDYTYTEYDNVEERAQTAANEQYTEITSNPADDPFEASITASNVEPCLSGTINIGGSPKNISICFNKSWMITGYGIMKVIMIALGYIQTALLLNRGMGG